MPAAAVIRGEQTLFGITGRKGRVGPRKWDVKGPGLTRDVRPILRGLSAGEDGGIPGVAVKCIDIGRNTSGEGAHLACY